MFPEMISRPDVGAFIHRATLQVTISAVPNQAFSGKCTLCIPFLLLRRVLTMTAQNKRLGTMEFAMSENNGQRSRIKHRPGHAGACIVTARDDQRLFIINRDGQHFSQSCPPNAKQRQN